ncbi:putative transcription factor B3-Domain family [Helianthus annuus]|nr:putative transcription factor B3-Domain family [Helianthus annuus]KAJ0479856.1 putative transcription factor B3-Domain family [Helianthus annuus]KAJ0662688.1 putative transcription factor B3-Domain family [Helianthus annuus]KAJ0670194.1 putative transcription factor B3-Domain family [Helianthus annuus]KAJ0848055.1 putative transcription factor B3-Domain family [Helianthus annuus]
MLSCNGHTLKGEMVYGFAGHVWNNDKKSLKLLAKYGEWIKTFSYPAKNTVIRTLDGRIFKVKVINIAGDYFLFNGWLDLLTSLKLPSNSWVVFQYEEALSSFRLFYFYQDISIAPSEYFYYKSGNVKDRDNCMYVNRLFVHHKMLNTCPSYPVVLWSSGKRKWFVHMDVIDNELYITTGWSWIKKEMFITDDHLVVFEMLDLRTFEISVFSCKPALLTYPPELCVTKQEPTDEFIEVSDDEVPNPIAELGVEQNQDDEVPVTFRVDNHYAQDHGLDRKLALTIKDNAGGTWDVAIGIEHCRIENRSKRVYQKNSNPYQRRKQ